MTKSEDKDRAKALIIETIKTQNPQSTQQLISLMQELHAILPEQTEKLLIELENEDKLHFKRQEQPVPSSPKAYAKTPQALWFWMAIGLAAATAISVFTINETSYPLTYIRQILGIVFVLFLPGYSLVKLLFPSKLPFQTSSEGMDQIERIALSLGLSLALTPMVGLILNYTPWGIRLAPVTLSLLSLTLVLATAAMLREHQLKTQINMETENDSNLKSKT